MAIQNQDQYMVRFPDGMRDEIKKAAEQNNRSMNAEIIARLENRPILPPDLAERVAAFAKLESLGNEERALAFLVEQGLQRIENIEMVTVRIDEALRNGDTMMEAARKALVGDPRLMSMSVHQNELIFRFKEDGRPVKINYSDRYPPSNQEIVALIGKLQENKATSTLEIDQAIRIAKQLADNGSSLNYIKFKIGYEERDEDDIPAQEEKP